jgi:hypothetical protein
MQKWITTFLISAMVIFITSVSVSAKPHDHHTSHPLVSPFDKTIELPHHCIVNGHSLSNPCPHLIKKTANSHTIAVACGGAPDKKQTIPEGAKAQKIFSEGDKYSDLPSSHSFRVPISKYSFILPSPLFHPPRFA